MTELKTIWQYKTTSTLQVTAAEQLDWYMLEWANGLERMLQLQEILLDNGRISHRRILTKEEKGGR